VRSENDAVLTAGMVWWELLLVARFLSFPGVHVSLHDFNEPSAWIYASVPGSEGSSSSSSSDRVGP